MIFTDHNESFLMVHAIQNIIQLVFTHLYVTESEQSLFARLQNATCASPCTGWVTNREQKTAKVMTSRHYTVLWNWKYSKDNQLSRSIFGRFLSPCCQVVLSLYDFMWSNIDNNDLKNMSFLNEIFDFINI